MAAAHPYLAYYQVMKTKQGESKFEKRLFHIDFAHKAIRTLNNSGKQKKIFGFSSIASAVAVEGKSRELVMTFKDRLGYHMETKCSQDRDELVELLNAAAKNMSSHPLIYRALLKEGDLNRPNRITGYKVHVYLFSGRLCIKGDGKPSLFPPAKIVSIKGSTVTADPTDPKSFSVQVAHKTYYWKTDKPEQCREWISFFETAAFEGCKAGGRERSGALSYPKDVDLPDGIKWASPLRRLSLRVQGSASRDRVFSDGFPVDRNLIVINPDNTQDDEATPKSSSYSASSSLSSIVTAEPSTATAAACSTLELESLCPAEIPTIEMDSLDTATPQLQNNLSNNLSNNKNKENRVNKDGFIHIGVDVHPPESIISHRRGAIPPPPPPTAPKVTIPHPCAITKRSAPQAPSTVLCALRAKVSKNKRRYQEGGFDLDLTYIRDRIIAMGFPSEGKDALYRNPLDEVVKFFETRHPGHYKLYNLCTEREYDPKHFGGRVERFAFNDHNPPPFNLLLDFCKSCHRFLEEDERNVVAIHCKAGKGRTGTCICAYLVFSGLFPNADEAMGFYDLARTFDAKGVTIPSQRRYVQLFSLYVLKQFAVLNDRSGYTIPYLQPCPRKLAGIRMFTCPRVLGSTCYPHFSIHQLQPNGDLTEWSSKEIQKVKPMTAENKYMDFNSDMLPLEGDILLKFYDKDVKIFHCWFNTYFVENNKIRLEKKELDGPHYDRANKFDAEFAIELYFR